MDIIKKGVNKKIDEYLKDSKILSTKYDWQDPENGDAITGVHFNNIPDTWDVPHNWDEFDKFNDYLKVSCLNRMGENV